MRHSGNSSALSLWRMKKMLNFFFAAMQIYAYAMSRQSLSNV